MQEKKTAEKWASENIREAGERTKEAFGRAQQSSTRALEGWKGYQLKLVAAAQANVNALFDYVQDLTKAQSVSQVLELSTEHVRRQLEMMADQTKDLTNSAQNLATHTGAPLTAAFGPSTHMS